MKTVESLKELYVKLNGNAEDVENISTIPEIIDKLTAIVDVSATGAVVSADEETLVVANRGD